MSVCGRAPTELRVISWQRPRLKRTSSRGSSLNPKSGLNPTEAHVSFFRDASYPEHQETNKITNGQITYVTKDNILPELVHRLGCVVDMIRALCHRKQASAILGSATLAYLENHVSTASWQRMKLAKGDTSLGSSHASLSTGVTTALYSINIAFYVMTGGCSALAASDTGGHPHDHARSPQPSEMSVWFHGA